MVYTETDPDLTPMATHAHTRRAARWPLPHTGPPLAHQDEDWNRDKEVSEDPDFDIPEAPIKAEYSQNQHLRQNRGKC
jgi:hypothetical protein